MLVFAKIKSVKQKIRTLPKGASIGFVPTMGALHDGHISLIERAKKENDIVVVSIFVNPTQFDREEDLINYPKTIDSDLSRLKNAYCDIVFTPSAEEMYADNIKSERFDFNGLDKEMEGKFREGHFDGVGTIVKRFFEIITPHKAYFGEKDFQQLQIIKKMVAITKLPVKIVECPVHRESDGLAMSSRNARLTKELREEAPIIYKVLKNAKKMFASNNISTVISYVEEAFKQHSLLKLEYFEIADELTLKPAREKHENGSYRAFIAVFAGEIRLIDTLKL